MTRPLTTFEQAVVLIAALMLGALIGFAYAGTTALIQPTQRTARAPDKCAAECERGCRPPGSCP